MGQRKENPERTLPPLRLWKFFEEDLLKSNPLTPVPVYSSQQQRRRFSPPQETLWQASIAWLRYHYTQTRWDIERATARLFHRRWGS
jgi:hypothetical protein